MSAHTPGPWTTYETFSTSLNGKRYRFLHIEDSTHVPIADVDTWLKPTLAKECEANARLLALSPTLLETLKRARIYLSPSHSQPCTQLLNEIDSLIAQAEGKE